MNPYFIDQSPVECEKTPLAKKSLKIPLVLAYGHHSYKEGPVPRSWAGKSNQAAQRGVSNR